MDKFTTSLQRTINAMNIGSAFQKQIDAMSIGSSLHKQLDKMNIGSAFQLALSAFRDSESFQNSIMSLTQPGHFEAAISALNEQAISRKDFSVTEDINFDSQGIEDGLQRISSSSSLKSFHDHFDTGIFAAHNRFYFYANCDATNKWHISQSYNPTC